MTFNIDADCHHISPGILCRRMATLFANAAGHQESLCVP